MRSKRHLLIPINAHFPNSGCRPCALPAQTRPQRWDNIERMVKAIVAKAVRLRFVALAAKRGGQLTQWTVESEKVLVV